MIEFVLGSAIIREIELCEASPPPAAPVKRGVVVPARPAAKPDLVVTGGSLDVFSGGGSGVAPSDETSTKGLKAGVFRYELNELRVFYAGTLAEPPRHR